MFSNNNSSSGWKGERLPGWLEGGGVARMVGRGRGCQDGWKEEGLPGNPLQLTRLTPIFTAHFKRCLCVYVFVCLYVYVFVCLCVSPWPENNYNNMEL